MYINLNIVTIGIIISCIIYIGFEIEKIKSLNSNVPPIRFIGIDKLYELYNIRLKILFYGVYPIFLSLLFYLMFTDLTGSIFINTIFFYVFLFVMLCYCMIFDNTRSYLPKKENLKIKIRGIFFLFFTATYSILNITSIKDGIIKYDAVDRKRLLFFLNETPEVFNICIELILIFNVLSIILSILISFIAFKIGLRKLVKNDTK